MARVFRGLVYVKHGRVGSKSEGPDYFLQTFEGDYLLAKESFPWAIDERLESFQRRMVEVSGELDEATRTITISEIKEIESPRIPPPDDA